MSERVPDRRGSQTGEGPRMERVLGWRGSQRILV